MSSSLKMDRKAFLKRSGLAGGLLMTSELIPKNMGVKSVRFGIITDLHFDLMHDGADRMRAFINSMKKESPEFIIQGGDFCVPKKENQVLMNIWNEFSGPKHHVLGNHDTDGGYSKEQVLKFWNAEGRYYSFDLKDYHFVILDGNEHNEDPNRPKGYARYISPKQVEWLKADLSSTNLPTVVFCHQGMDNDAGGLENGTLLRYTLENSNKNGGSKVILVISGHHHQDYHNIINGIHYLQINSASYQWLGEEYQEIRYSAEVDKSFPWLKNTVPYKDPIWAIIEINSKGEIMVQGRHTVFVGSSPEQLGVDMHQFIYPIVPYISDRKIKF
ncbi:metallophosphoesterase family protein [Dyadobacter tibetensis]|uniref:metallophosphoesterase family protein n=1 Tax=Dyadobacter tibetensis TaxID=1211851 RepID=UPI0004B75CFB|nr:metallophosphoesterase [Dyadobacter tibetensis]